jgi:soluble lytic murein transglycosylase-like protein
MSGKSLKGRRGSRALGWLVAALLCLERAPGDAEVQRDDSLAEILVRSYERQALKNILGRSAGQSMAARATALQRQEAARLRPEQPAGMERFGHLIDHYSHLHGLDANLVRAVIQAESNGNPQALSPKGAAGLMQLMPETAAHLGAVDRFDPEQNIASGTRYLRELLDRFQSVELALWAYNAGPQAVQEGRLPAETQAYVPRVLKLRRQFAQEGD